MLTPAQQQQLDEIVHAVHAALEVEEASLEAPQTLCLVLCNAVMCFQPIRITPAEADVPAALAGQPDACQALQTHLRTVLQGLL
ncbi:MAG: hypothetical protein AB7N91_02950 [Candidatus Tectimicrobiota bacterium]